jgi:apolipoprotein N-acyltransferase
LALAFTKCNRRVAAILAGILLPLAFAPFDLFWLAPFSVAALFLLWEEQLPQESAIIGIFYGVGVYTLGTYWLFISLRQLGGAPIPIVIMLMSALVIAMSFYMALTGVLITKLAPKSDAARWLLVMPAIWVIVEWLRGWFLTGFPWLSLGYSQVDTTLGAWAPLLGVHGVSWVCSLVAGLIVCILRGSLRLSFFAIGALLAILSVSMLLQGVRWTIPRPESLNVSLVQAAIPQELKWSREYREPTLDFYRETTLSLQDQDLVIWPEAAIPALPFEVNHFLNDMNIAMREKDIQLFSGILTFESKHGEFKNTLMGIGTYTGEYHKRHLVPFGEYFPVPGFIEDWLRLMNLPSEDITAGEDIQELLMVKGIPIAPTICYEVAFGAEQLGFLPDAELLLNVSNDTWFGDSIAPHQHLQMARMRSMETGRPMLRATNTGITAIISADGEITDQIPQFLPGVLSSRVQPHAGRTPYIRFGNSPIVLFSLLLMMAPMLRKKSIFSRLS